MLTVGAASVLTGCSASPPAGGVGAASPSRSGGAPRSGPAPPLPPVPDPHPGPNEVVARGAGTGRRIALTVDDGTSAAVVAGYADFAARTGIHLTFSPNGTYNREWAPHADTLRPLIAQGQVQIINHTFTHRDLRALTSVEVRDELQRNDDWVIHTFGITTRPYYRPPLRPPQPRDRRPSPPDSATPAQSCGTARSPTPTVVTPAVPPGRSSEDTSNPE